MRLKTDGSAVRIADPLSTNSLVLWALPRMIFECGSLACWIPELGLLWFVATPMVV